jgi:prefoldin alpha subunit
MDEKELQQSIRTLEFYKAQLESFDQQFEFLAMTLKEHNQARDTMVGYKDLAVGSETLIPVGASSFLFAKVDLPDKALVGIGADYAVKTDMDKAISKMDERIKDIEDAMKSFGDRYKEMAGKATELSAQIQEAYVAHQ